MKYSAPAMERKRMAGLMARVSINCSFVLCAPGNVCEDTPNGPQCVPV